MRVSWLTEPDEDWDQEQEQAPPARHRLRLVAAVLAGWLAVSLIVLVGLLRFGQHDAGRSPAAPTRPATTAPAGSALAGSAPAGSAPATSQSGGAVSSSAAAGGVPGGWQLRAEDDQANCTAHSHGQVQVFFARTPCSALHRSLFSASQDGHDLVVAASTVTFAGAEQAGQYLRLVTSDGTGNVNDLLREGTRYPGSPSKLPPAAFASRQDGSRVLVAEAAYTGQPAAGTPAYRDATLQAAARRAVDAG